jgi:hypothetical protein
MSEEIHLYKSVLEARAQKDVNKLSQIVQDLEWSRRKLSEAQNHLENLETMSKQALENLSQENLPELVIHNWTGPIQVLMHTLSDVRNILTKKR